MTDDLSTLTERLRELDAQMLEYLNTRSVHAFAAGAMIDVARRFAMYAMAAADAVNGDEPRERSEFVDTLADHLWALVQQDAAKKAALLAQADESAVH